MLLIRGLGHWDSSGKKRNQKNKYNIVKLKNKIKKLAKKHKKKETPSIVVVFLLAWARVVNFNPFKILCLNLKYCVLKKRVFF